MEHLREGKSPEQIAGRLKFVLYPDGSLLVDLPWNDLCFHLQGETDMTEQDNYLNGWKKKKTKIAVTVPMYLSLFMSFWGENRSEDGKRGRKSQRLRIPDRVSIHDRPKVIDRRNSLVIGRNTVEGRGHRDGVHTEVERVSRLIEARKVKAIDSQSALDAQRKIFGVLPAKPEDQQLWIRQGNSSAL